MQDCEKCAERAAIYEARARASLPYAERALTAVRQRLRKQPPQAIFLAADRVQDELLELSLTVGDLSRILALGTAIASMRTRSDDGYWLSVRGNLEQGGLPRTFILVAHYQWPPPEIGRWPLILTRVIEAGRWHSAEGYPRCWCNHAKENDHAV